MTQILVVLLGLVLGFAGSRVGRKVRSGRRSDAAAPARRSTATGSAPAPAPTRSGTGSKAAASAAGIGRSVGGALGGRKNLTLPHLQRAAFSELIRHVTTDRGGRTSIPVESVILLHPDDQRRVADAERWFCAELAKALVGAARDHGWEVPAPPVITVEADPGRAPGTPGVRVLSAPAPVPPPVAPARNTAPTAAPTAASTAGPPPTGPRQALLTRTDDASGDSHHLSGDAVTIGRGSDRDIRVEEARASRNHGTFRPSRSGPGWTYTDEGSSNGTTINGRRVDAGRRQALRDGDSIQIGDTTFTYSTPLPDAPAPAPAPGPAETTQALDEVALEDLTGVYFPPPLDEPGP